MTPTFVVLGTGLCAGAAVQTLRDEGFDGRIVLVGEEPHLPYERPPLSKEYLQGQMEQPRLFMQPAHWYAENAVETRLGIRARQIRPTDRVVELADGERLPYDKLLIATGGRPYQLPGPPLERVLYLRTIEDAERIRAHLASGRHLVVIGAGFIGAEVAASARTLGLTVAVLEMLDVPLARVLGRELGQVCADIHRDDGVELRTGEGVAAIEPTASGVVVRTTTGTTPECDVVVAGVGIQPNSELAFASGVEIERGIVVDEYCRTNVPEIYAAGDVANHYHPVFGRHIRVEHYDNALKQGATAARNMLGRAQVFDDPHWFWSDQYRHNWQYAGFAPEWDELIIRGALPERNFIAFDLKDGLVRAALGLNRGRDVRRAMKLIQARAAVEPAKLRDEDIDLRSLVPRG